MSALRGRFRQVVLWVVFLALMAFWMAVFFAVGSIMTELRR